MTGRQHLALVTGTTSGIGAALARALCDDGWQVLGLARRSAGIEHPHYRHLQVDLGDPAGLQTAADDQIVPQIADTGWDRVGLVNNAAMIGALCGLEAIGSADLSRIFAVNTVAPMVLMGLVAREAPPSASLRIVNISTGAAVTPYPGLGDYGSSKAALRMAGMIMAEELSSDNRPGGRHPDAAILSYEPGVVDTDMQVQARSTKAEESPWNEPFRDFAAQGLLEKPEDVITGAVDFLSGECEAPFVERRFGGD